MSEVTFKKEFGTKGTVCSCDQRRPYGTCKQCFNRLVIALAEAREKFDIADRMYTTINNENNTLRAQVDAINDDAAVDKKFRKAMNDGSKLN